jgi:membrane fusion protein (multidrug efflux system)
VEKAKDMPEVQEQQESQNQDQRGNHEEQHHTDDSHRRGPAAPRRKRAIRFIILALVVVGIIIAIPIYAYYSVRESTDDAQVDGHVIPISPRVNGTIMSVLVNDNQQVKAGQELVRLDPADFQVALQQARAQLATAEANTT